MHRSAESAAYDDDYFQIDTGDTDKAYSCLIVGDLSAGPIPMAQSLIERQYPWSWTSEAPVEGTFRTNAEGMLVEFKLVGLPLDSSLNYDTFRQLFLEEVRATDVLVFTFSLASPLSLQRISKFRRMVGELLSQDKEPVVPLFFVVGTCTDVRDAVVAQRTNNEVYRQLLHHYAQTSTLSPSDVDAFVQGTMRVVPTPKALTVACDVGAMDYFECSLLPGGDVENVFTCIATHAIHGLKGKHKRGKRKGRMKRYKKYVAKQERVLDERRRLYDQGGLASVYDDTVAREAVVRDTLHYWLCEEKAHLQGNHTSMLRSPPVVASAAWAVDRLQSSSPPPPLPPQHQQQQPPAAPLAPQHLPEGFASPPRRDGHHHQQHQATPYPHHHAGAPMHGPRSRAKPVRLQFQDDAMSATFPSPTLSHADTGMDTSYPPASKHGHDAHMDAGDGSNAPAVRHRRSRSLDVKPGIGPFQRFFRGPKKGFAHMYGSERGPTKRVLYASAGRDVLQRGSTGVIPVSGEVGNGNGSARRRHRRGSGGGGSSDGDDVDGDDDDEYEPIPHAGEPLDRLAELNVGSKLPSFKSTSKDHLNVPFSYTQPDSGSVSPVDVDVELDTTNEESDEDSDEDSGGDDGDSSGLSDGEQPLGEPYRRGVSLRGLHHRFTSQLSGTSLLANGSPTDNSFLRAALVSTPSPSSSSSSRSVSREGPGGGAHRHFRSHKRHHDGHPQQQQRQEQHQQQGSARGGPGANGEGSPVTQQPQPQPQQEEPSSWAQHAPTSPTPSPFRTSSFDDCATLSTTAPAPKGASAPREGGGGAAGRRGVHLLPGAGVGGGDTLHSSLLQFPALAKPRPSRQLRASSPNISTLQHVHGVPQGTGVRDTLVHPRAGSVSPVRGRSPSPQAEEVATVTPMMPSASAVTVQERHFPDGSLYRGQWKRGRFDGQGKLVYADGSTYVGTFENGLFQGYGEFLWPDGSTYTGIWMRGQRHGKGEQRFVDGSVYMGDWMHDRKHGNGVLTLPDQSVYVGEFANDIMEGKGHLAYPTGSAFGGRWSGGKKSGPGIYERWDGQHRKVTYADNALVKSEEVDADVVQSELEAQKAFTDKLLQSIVQIDMKQLQISTKKLGEGYYGEVYYGTHMGGPVAIKKVKENIPEDVRAKFVHEVHMLSHVHHPHIVRYIGASLVPGNFLIVTEYLPGGSLWDVIHSAHQSLDSTMICKFAMQIASAVAYLHGYTPKIVHRDLKSPNILLDEHMNVKVADFGLSRWHTDTTMTRGVGTAAWSAPEVVRFQAYSEKADVYSFGIVCWEMWARKVPYAPLTRDQIILAVAMDNKRPELPPGLPTQWRTLITKCWATEEAERPSFELIMMALADMQCETTTTTSAQQ